MKTLAKIAVMVALTAGLSSAAVNFPFPQNSNYGGNGVVLSNQASAASQLKQMFQWYMSTLYNENGSYSCIRANPGDDQCFSEGVGYGMLMLVYFSDNERSYQAEFDKMWAFYKASEDANGLMNWKVGKADPTQIWGTGAALDGDLDAAAALIMAAYQFGDQNYLSEAKTLIHSIKAYEFESNGLHLCGDQWGEGGYTKKNPGYYDPAYARLFALADPDNADFWLNVSYDANMKLYETNSAETSTGLINDWTDQYGNSFPGDNDYNYDATRSPWRNAKAIYWFGDTRSLAINKKMGAWVSSQSASSVAGPVGRSGSMGSDHNGTFVGTLMTSLGSDASYQSKLDEFWSEVVRINDQTYFEKSLAILSGLLVSGNMPNFAAGDAPQALRKMTPAVAAISLSGRTLSLNYAGSVRADLLSINGQVVKPLWSGEMKGSASVSLQGIPSGLYLVRIQTASGVSVQKLKVR